MSLLNDMLRNLDARQPTSRNPEDGTVVPQHSPPAKNRLVRSLLVIVVMVGIGLVGFGLLQMPKQEQTTPVVTSFPAEQREPTNVVQRDPEPRVESQPAVTQPAPPPIQEEETPEPIELAVEDEPAVPDEVIVDEFDEVEEPVWMSAREINAAQSPEESMAASILAEPSSAYAVQLLVLQDKDKLLDHAQSIGLDDPLYTRMQKGSQDVYVLLLGVYPNYLSAVAARDDWVDSSGTDNTWIRPIAPLQEAVAAATSFTPSLTKSSVSQTDLGLSNRDREVQKLLAEAEQALIQERLTSPPNDNAYDRYRRVLELSTDHPEALAGIEAIVSQYLRLASEYIDTNQIDRATVLVERARQVGGRSSEVAALERRLSSAPQTAQNTTPNRPAENKRQEDITVKKSSRMSEEALLSQVDNLLAQDAAFAARSLLEEYLVSDPESAAAATALFRLYLQTNDIEIAEKLIAGGGALPALTVVELTAQLKAHEGDLNGAINILESARPDSSETSYYALLASLYQQAGRFSEAASRYRLLLAKEPEQGAFWLGLAVSLDSSRNSREALIAFQRTRDTGQYDGDVEQYIEQRIEALSR